MTLLSICDTISTVQRLDLCITLSVAFQYAFPFKFTILSERFRKQNKLIELTTVCLNCSYNDCIEERIALPSDSNNAVVAMCVVQ